MTERPEPPAIAVIFTSRFGADTEGYDRMAARMEALATEQDGFLGMDSARGPDGLGITVSYWRDEEAVRAWKRNVEHVAAQELGRARWYAEYSVRVARLLRVYDWSAEAAGPGG